MKNKKTWIFTLCLGVIVLCFLLAKNTLMLPFLYDDSPSLSSVDNDYIKGEILETIKANHSFFAKNKSPGKSYSLIIAIEEDFMKTLKPTGDNKISVEVQTKWPDDRKYYFTFEKTGGKMTLVKYEVDP